MSRTGVWVTDASFRAAIAQLPERLEPSVTPRGAICVVDGSRERAAAVRSLIDERPLAIVLINAARTQRAMLDVLTDAGLPVVVDRPFLRPDDVRDVGAPAPRHVIVDVVSGRLDFRAALVDAVGWVRTLVGGPLDVIGVARTAEALASALEGPDGATAVIGAVRQSTAIGPALVIDGLGPQRLEIEIDAVAGIREIRLHDDDRVVVGAPRYEARERLALRRALDAISGMGDDDLGGLLHDRALADSLMDAAAT